MRHVPEATLRRLIDEPLAVADADAGHVERCGRCNARREEIVHNAAAASALLSRQQPVPDVDSAWTRLQRSLSDPASPARSRQRVAARRHWRLVALPLPSTAALAAAAVLVAGGATAAAFTTVFAPTRISPVPVSSTDLASLANVTGINGSGVIGGFRTPSGSSRLAFGVVTWSSAGSAYRAASIAAADKATGMNLRLPRLLPDGVGSAKSILVQPEVTATIRFNAGAGRALDGKSLTITAGPAVLVEYGSSTPSLRLPTLGTFAMERPTASSSTATVAQLEAFILSRPGIPSALAAEVRLLQNIGTTLPVPTPPDSQVTHVDVGGSPGISISEASGVASGVIWEDRSGVVHAVLGLLDQKDILDVANQLG